MASLDYIMSFRATWVAQQARVSAHQNFTNEQPVHIMKWPFAEETSWERYSLHGYAHTGMLLLVGLISKIS